MYGRSSALLPTRLIATVMEGVRGQPRARQPVEELARVHRRIVVDSDRVRRVQLVRLGAGSEDVGDGLVDHVHVDVLGRQDSPLSEPRRVVVLRRQVGVHVPDEILDRRLIKAHVVRDLDKLRA